jgi:hypothetical protein
MPEATEKDTNNSESSISESNAAAKPGSPGWLKFALLTAASALAGGVATAWFYRKTLAKLRESGENPKTPNFGIQDGRNSKESSDDI